MKIGNFFEKSDTLIVLTLRASYWGTKQVVCCFCRASWAKLSSSSFNLFTLLLLASGPGPIQPPSLPTCCLPKRFLSTGYPLSTSTYSSSVISPNAALTAEQWTNIQLKSEFVFWPIFTTLTRQNRIPYCLKIMLKCLIFEQKKFKCFCPSKKIGYMAS